MSMTNSINEKGIIEHNYSVKRTKQQRDEKVKNACRTYLMPPTKEVHALQESQEEKRKEKPYLMKQGWKSPRHGHLDS